MKKAFVVFLLILSIVACTQVHAKYIPDNEPEYNSEDIVTFIVEMEDSPVRPEFNLSGDNVSRTEIKRADKYRDSLLRSQESVTHAIGEELSEEIKPRYTYTELFNGFAIDAKYGDLETIKNTEGVKAVYISSETKADFRMSNAPSMTHSLPAETFGHTGSGQVIAILDSEFDVKHVAFSKEPQNPKYTKQDIADIFSNTNFNASADVNRVYESSKIPFRYDYGEGDADTYSTVSVHGTHVAGIAAGCSPEGDFSGVAPDAQLVLMKISNSKGALSDAATAAALDDAAKLGVCAINCSFGYDYRAKDAYSPVIIAIYENAYKAGIFVSASAGNSTRGFFGGTSKTINIDDSATGTPNVLESTISIASVENDLISMEIAEITLSDGNVIDSIRFHNFTAPLVAGDYEYCGLGYPEDFEGVDVNGKIAVVERGAINFTVKSDNAKAAGAVGMILINSDDEFISTSELSLPALCVKSSSGSLFKDAEVKTITSIAPFTQKQIEVDGVISSFSSYGTTESLGLKPEISAPGGNIYSSLPGDKYGYMSGTSMAAPHIAGVVAIMNQYLDDIGCTLVSSERTDFIGNLLMSSADVVYMKSDDEENKVPYSPRVQGAGLVNTANAIKTPVILYAESGRTKIELGDNLTDTLEISFTAQNLTENDVVYDKMSAVTLTDGYVNQNGTNYISGAKLLKSELITDFDTITVPANSSVTVSAQIKLDIDELNENYLVFSNGFHIDGFIRLESTTEDIISVGMPFMGFFGNWTQAPVFDTTIYDEGGSTLVKLDKNVVGTLLYTDLNGEFTDLGYNSISDTYSYDTIVISPNGDGNHDMLALLLTPMRSIRNLKVMLVDEDENILSVQEEAVLNKYRSYETDIILPENLPDGSYVVRIEGYMNYDTDNSIKHSMSIPVKVERERSFLKGYNLDGNTLTLDLCDPVGILHVLIKNKATGEMYVKSFDSCVTNGRLTHTFEGSTAPDPTDITVETLDTAWNYWLYTLGGFGGKLGASVYRYNFDKEGYAVIFQFDSDEVFEDASLILAFYDETGKLMHTNVIQNQTVSSGQFVFTGESDLTDAYECKLFIWDDTNTATPLDTVKVFNMTLYE